MQPLTLNSAEGWHVHWGVHLDVEFAMAVVSVSVVEFAFAFEIELPCGLGFEVDTTRSFRVAVAAPVGKNPLSTLYIECARGCALFRCRCGCCPCPMWSVRIQIHLLTVGVCQRVQADRAGTCFQSSDLPVISAWTSRMSIRDAGCLDRRKTR